MNESLQLELFDLVKEHAIISRKLARLSRRHREVTGTIRRLKARLSRARIVGTKQCRKCGETMDVDQFYKDDRYADGFHPWCRECKRIFNKNKQAA